MDFASRWQFPNCLGAVDGKHVAIVCPPESGSRYFNYKGTFSIVLLAVADSECKFVIIDVGAEGRQSDGGTLKNSDFGSALIEGSLGIPALACLPCTSTNVPYVFIGDEAFQLRRDFMRPFPARQLDDSRRIFNYRLSRARRCVENAFGITAARWRILLRTINLLPENVDYVIKAACVLHNFLTVHNPHSQTRKTASGTLLEGAGGKACKESRTTASSLFSQPPHGTSMEMQLLLGTCSQSISPAVLGKFLGSGAYQECRRSSPEVLLLSNYCRLCSGHFPVNSCQVHFVTPCESLLPAAIHPSSPTLLLCSCPLVDHCACHNVHI